MERIKEEFLDNVEGVVSLVGKNILEIGCGNGSRSVQIATRCAQLVSIDPNLESVATAKTNNPTKNIEYKIGKAENLDFNDKQFDAVIFTLSLHHVPIDQMPQAIDEAIRVTKRDGNIIFLEPTESGSFFEAELAFDACDGDERKEKAAAYTALTCAMALAKGKYSLPRAEPPTSPRHPPSKRCPVRPSKL